MIGKYFAAAVIAGACLLSACAPVQRTSRAMSDQARTFAPLPDKAVVYVYRNTILGAAISMDVSVDGRPVGATGADSFFQLALPPGHHTLVSKAENSASLDLDVQAGQNYYVWQQVKFGFVAARTGLQRVDASEGEAEVRKLKLLATTTADFRMPATAPGTSMAGSVVVPARHDAETYPEPATAPLAAAAAPRPAAPMTAPAPTTTPVAATEPTLAPVSGGLAVRDDRVGKPMFVAAQDVASRHQCERAIRVRSVDGDDAHFYSQCPGSSTPIEILCNGANCHEGAPQG